jgi:hypothetical protein
MSSVTEDQNKHTEQLDPTPATSTATETASKAKDEAGKTKDETGKTKDEAGKKATGDKGEVSDDAALGQKIGDIISNALERVKPVLDMINKVCSLVPLHP